MNFLIPQPADLQGAFETAAAQNRRAGWCYNISVTEAKTQPSMLFTTKQYFGIPRVVFAPALLPPMLGLVSAGHSTKSGLCFWRANEHIWRC